MENISHRGFAKDCPENSLQAMSQGWEAGATILETDVQVCRDGTLILFHDRKVDDVAVENLNVEELEAKVGHDVALFTDFLAANKAKGRVLLDLKIRGETFLNQVVAGITVSGFPAEALILQSTVHEELVFLKTKLPQIRTHWLTGLKRIPPVLIAPDANELAKACSSLGIDGVTAKGRKFVDADFIEASRDEGLDYYVWTINPPDRISHYRDLGVTGIVSDNPAVVRQVLSDHP